MGERCDYQRLSSAEEEEEMLTPLPHSLSDSTGLRAPRPGGGRHGRPPQQDVTLGMPCRRVSAGGKLWGSGGTCVPERCWVLLGRGVRGGLVATLPCMASPHWGPVGVAWGWHPPRMAAPLP